MGFPQIKLVLVFSVFLATSAQAIDGGEFVTTSKRLQKKVLLITSNFAETVYFLNTF